MTSLSVSTAPVIANESDGKWWAREVRQRVEFVLDGRTLSDLLEQGGFEGVEYMVTPFETVALDPVAVLAGQTPYEDWIPDTSRVPLLVCPCGDLYCGAVTVRMSRHHDKVEWSDWSWENYDEPLAPLSLATCRVDANAYADALQEAEGLALANRNSVTRMRVRAPGPWWRNIVRDPSERTDPQTMLAWLNAEAVKPALGDAEGDYAAFLIDLDWAQTLLAGEASSKEGMNDELRSEAVSALRGVSVSPHRICLPPETLQAVRWHLSRLQPQCPPRGPEGEPSY